MPLWSYSKIHNWVQWREIWHPKAKQVQVLSMLEFFWMKILRMRLRKHPPALGKTLCMSEKVCRGHHFIMCISAQYCMWRINLGLVAARRRQDLIFTSNVWLFNTCLGRSIWRLFFEVGTMCLPCIYHSVVFFPLHDRNFVGGVTKTMKIWVSK